jgi:type IV secretory pathway component VirB8
MVAITCCFDSSEMSRDNSVVRHNMQSYHAFRRIYLSCTFHNGMKIFSPLVSAVVQYSYSKMLKISGQQNLSEYAFMQFNTVQFCDHRIK